MRKTKSFLLLFLLLMLFWILLAGTSSQELILGSIVAFLLTLLFYRKATILADITVSFKAALYMLVYLFIFLFELIKSNLDVALRVLDPKLPINPGIVKVKTRLRSRLGRIILANSITLTPGTLTVETKGEDFYIHWIDITSDDIDSASEEIIRKFEPYLEVIFG